MIAVVGAGAAGLAAAIFAARRGARGPMVALDGAARLGAKILVSGGGRCNVTNRVVTPADFRGGRPAAVRRVLAGFPAEAAVDFFREIGVALHEEEDGKLFPDSNRARDVLTALLEEAERRGVRLQPGHRVLAVRRESEAFRVETSRGPLSAHAVVLATGGMSLPKTGSDGAGYALAESLGHTLTPRTPALVPLVLDGDFHVRLAGVSHRVELTVRGDDAKAVRVRGALLWTHFGASGPAVLDASRFWHAATRPRTSADLVPGRSFAGMEERLLDEARSSPRRTLEAALAEWLPGAVARAALAALGIAAGTRLGQLSREDRRRLLRALLDWPLPVRDSRGWNFAEVTAGGVPLAQVDPSTMESRRTPGLFVVGEILDVDGRLGGFNFQWAWSTGFAAARGLAAGSADRRVC